MAIILRDLWNSYVKRQALLVPTPCYAVANYLAGVYQSIGIQPEICLTSGDFSSAYAKLTSCTSRYSTNGTLATVTNLEKPLSYCSSVISSYGQAALQSAIAASGSEAACSSYSSAGNTAELSLLNCPGFSTGSTSIASSSATLTSPTPTQTSTQPATQSPTQTPTPSHSLTTGAITGIAVGAAIFFILLAAFVIFFVWRHRRQRKNDKVVQEQVLIHGEKAQLHSDDVQPKREEMEGSKVPRKVRVIGGVHEVENTGLMTEMDVNEVAAAEADGSKGTHASDGQTGSLTAVEGRTVA